MLNQPEIKVLPYNYYLVNASGRSIQIHPGRSYTVGRDVSCDIRISDTLLSRHHCRLDWSADTQWSLVDTESSNGTFVNDSQIKGGQRLKDRDRIRFGGQILTLYYVKLDEKAENLADQSKSYRDQATLDLSGAYANRGDARSALSGSLHVIPLPSLLQLFHNNKLTGHLILDDRDTRGIWFVSGKPVHAIYDIFAGREALLHILENAATFNLHLGDELDPKQKKNLLHKHDDDLEMHDAVLGTEAIVNSRRGTEQLPSLDQESLDLE